MMFEKRTGDKELSLLLLKVNIWVVIKNSEYHDWAIIWRICTLRPAILSRSFPVFQDDQ